MTSRLIARGMLVGLLASFLAFAFAWKSGEPNVDAAIAVEEHHAHMAGEAEEPELVSRHVQSTLGLFTGVAVYGTAVGGLFALVFAFAQGRMGRLHGREQAIVLAACAFVALIVVPMLKYPSNPPSVGSPETISHRTGLYFSMVLISVLSMIAAVITAVRRTQQHGVWNGVLSGVLLYVVIVAIAAFFMPAVSEVPSDFPAQVLYDFRLTTLGIHFILWTCLGLGFGAWVLRLEKSYARQRQLV